mmetsp:Transcript_36772/g.79230  ORF Transcript_36772/g.79230 Transcript_36772/m.79230 type:complete len:219 (-) Transcript_36772:1179-1835(-)
MVTGSKEDSLVVTNDHPGIAHVSADHAACLRVDHGQSARCTRPFRQTASSQTILRQGKEVCELSGQNLVHGRRLGEFRQVLREVCEELRHRGAHLPALFSMAIEDANQDFCGAQGVDDAGVLILPILHAAFLARQGITPNLVISHLLASARSTATLAFIQRRARFALLWGLWGKRGVQRLRICPRCLQAVFVKVRRGHGRATGNHGNQSGSPGRRFLH